MESKSLPFFKDHGKCYKISKALRYFVVFIFMQIKNLSEDRVQVFLPRSLTEKNERRDGSNFMHFSFLLDRSDCFYPIVIKPLT